MIERDPAIAARRNPSDSTHRPTGGQIAVERASREPQLPDSTVCFRGVHRDVTKAPPIPQETELLLHTFVALCLGALVGLERQVAQEESRGEKDFPGVRTLALTGLVGALAVLLARELSEWMAVALFLAFVTLLVLRFRYDTVERGDPGYTTEVASVCVFAVGALAQAGQLLVATVITISVVVLLRSKRVMHRAGELLRPQDMEVLLRFLVVTGIVLPLLPNRAYDPLGVVRLRDVWWMAVLISGISFLGYVLMRLGAGRRGRMATGFLGGLVSSTASTVSYARSARQARDARSAEGSILLAATGSYVRMAGVLAVVAPTLFLDAGATLGVMLVLSLAIGLALHGVSAEGEEPMEMTNPLSLRVATGFALLYAVVLLLTSAAGEMFDAKGSFAVAALASTLRADAPIASIARLAADARLAPGTAVVGVAVVAVAATLGKLAILAAGGRFGPVLRAGAGLGLVAVAGGLVTALLS